MSVDLGRDSKRSALEYIKQERKFTALLRWIDTAKLEDALANMETVTVFAPSNKAFQRLEKIWSQHKLEGLWKYMEDIVKYHVVSQKLTADVIAFNQAREQPYFPSLLLRESSRPELINFYYDDASRELTLNRTIGVGKPIVVTNGLIYPIDDVLLPVHLENKIGYLETTTI